MFFSSSRVSKQCNYLHRHYRCHVLQQQQHQQYQQQQHIRSVWIMFSSTSEPDFHWKRTFRVVLKSRCVSNFGNDQLQIAKNPCVIIKSSTIGQVRTFVSESSSFDHSTNQNKNMLHDSNYNNSSTLGQLELDFFGEPVTFIGLDPDEKSSKKKKKKLTAISNAMAAFDGFLLVTVSKGLSCTDGGDEGGLEAKSAHSAAVSWSEILQYAAVWNQRKPIDCNENENDDNDDNDDNETQNNNNNTQTTSKYYHKSAPMLSVVAVVPLLIHAGLPYIKHLDTLLRQTKPAVPGLPVIQMYEIGKTAAACKDDVHLNPRERMHLKAFHYLLSDQYSTALATYCKLLRSCPGDALALSFTMDLCQVLGDKQAALSAAGSVAAYWNERRGGIITPAIPGQSIAGSLMALGFAVGGKVDEAEIYADRAMNQGKKVSGALATWAQCHVFDAKGRVSEGISALANFDGIQNYEGAGFLFFDCRLSGYGARFSLDREERGRGKSAALRLYECNFERVLNYSGFGQGQAWKHPAQRAPLAWRDTKNLAIEDGDKSSTFTFVDWLMGRSQQKEQEKTPDYELIIQQINFPSTNLGSWEPSAEDILTWLPPTPQFLSDATLLCLRFTFNGTISNRNARWDSIRNAWSSMLEIHDEHGSDNRRLTFCPLVSVVASLLFHPKQTGGDQIGTGRLASGLYRLGELLQLGNPETDEQKETAVREYVAERSPSFWLPSDESQRKEWRSVVDNISSAIDGLEYAATIDTDIDRSDFHADPNLRFRCWDFEARPILEHAIVYAACKSGDTESLCLARSICSHGVTIRCNSPEEWWRYSIVLGLLGDEIASEDALVTSVNLGGGQGATGTYGKKNYKKSPPEI